MQDSQQDPLSHPVTAFAGIRFLSAGPLVEVAMAIKNAGAGNTSEPILAFDDATGRVVDLDLRGSKAEIIERLQRRSAIIPSEANAPSSPAPSESSGELRGRGRPKLGVVAREVTLLPRHWEWLAAQAGGASVTLRRLVEEARRGDTAGSRQRRRDAQEAAYRFMLALAGDLPGYEEACRALFADDRQQFQQHIAQWPADVGRYATQLAFGAH